MPIDKISAATPLCNRTCRELGTHAVLLSHVTKAGWVFNLEKVLETWMAYYARRVFQWDPKV